MKRLTFLCIGLFSFIFVISQPPTKDELQRKNAQLAKEIADIRADLDKARGDKKVTLGLLTQLNQSISKRNQVISNIKGEVYYIEKDISKTYREIDTLKKELDTLKVQYAKSIVYAYKNRSNYDFLNFLFSAGNFNDAIKRLSYLKTYRQYREQQAGRIKNANEVLDAKAKSLTVKRGDKKNALTEQNNQMNELEQDKKKKDQALNVIKSQESQLAGNIAKKEKQRKQNADNINRIIKEEIAAARRREQERLKAEADARKRAADLAAKNNQSNTPSTTMPAKTVASAAPAKKAQRAPSVLEQTPEGLVTSQNFEINKGNLPWPVSQGTISIPFGNYNIPGTGIKGVSDGITIETSKGATVKSIFQGEVISVYAIGGNQTVIIKHGKYFTTYANLGSVSVSRGQKVTTGQAIGSAGEDDDGTPEVELRIDTEHGPINPTAWIRR